MMIKWNLVGFKNFDRRYGNQVMSVPINKLQRYIVHISGDV